MKMLIITGIQAEAILKALCWTFIHSLWQGLGFALLAGILLLFTRRAAPALRYNLLSLILLLFVVTAGITFSLQLPGTGGAAGLSTVLPSHYAAPAAGAEKFTWQSFARYCDNNAPLLVLLWFIVFMTKFVKMIGGLLHIKRIRSYGVSSPGTDWQERAKELAALLHINVPVHLLESTLVRVPIVVGWLKPVIMIPAGLLTQLPQDQIDAILLHELAHIRRKDYFVNLLQSFVEILFFFNPAVRWLSALLREEREHCCDDLAINGINNKNTYIKALVAFQEYHLSDGVSSALAFAGSKHQLLDRVRRMVFNNNKNLNIMEKLFLTTSIFVLVGISFIPVAKTQAQKYHVLPGGTAVTDTINGVIRPVKDITRPVAPDNRLQHIVDNPVQDSLQVLRDAAQRERDKMQHQRDSIQSLRDIAQRRRMQEENIRAAAFARQEEVNRKREEAAKAMARQAQSDGANAKGKNVSRDVPAIKPVSAVPAIPATSKPSTQPKPNSHQ